MDQKFIRQLIRYEPDTGKVFWKKRDVSLFKSSRSCRSWNTRYAGKEIMNIDGKGYNSVFIMGEQYRVHRLIWLLVYGHFPKIIDHINGDKLDNRLENLKEVTQQENLMNQRRSSKNTSGVTGVYFNKKRGLWCAQMKFNGETYHLGSSKNKEEVIEMRKKEEQRLGFSRRHGSAR
jgi:hypothetical protein